MPELKNLQIARLHRAPYHQRTLWGDMTALAASLTEHGVIEPLVVRERPKSAGGGYEVICGERRRRAAEKAELATVPCVVVDVDDATAIQIQIEENLKRENLHPMDEAAYFAELAGLGFDAGDIARRFGVKRKHIERRLKLNALAPVARKAFVAGKIDEEGAFALARGGDVAKQTDVIASVEAGHLQPEEIAAYVARTFSASLEDVPWRISDAELVAKAGACTACPKRTSVQRDLFDNVKGDRCLDIDCYRGKMDATFELEHAKPGVTLWDGDAPNLFVPTAGGRPAVMKSSAMIDAEAPCPYLTGHTWREAIALSADAGEGPAEYLARDQDGRPRFVYREATAARLVKRSDAGTAAKEAAEAADPNAAGDDKATQRAEAKIRRAMVDQLSELVAAGDHDVWGWVAARVLDGATARAQAGAVTQFADALTELGIEGKAGLVELIGKSNRWAKRVSVAVLIRDEADLVGEIPPSLMALAKLCELDVIAIERGIRGS